MKLLFFQWHSFMNKGIEKSLQKLNIEYEVFFYQFKDWEKDDLFCNKLDTELKSGNFSTVFSVNFSPLISQICEQKGIPYIAWVYDVPIHIREVSSMKNSCTKIYLFDRGQVEEYNKQGIPVKYMPLAVDETTFTVLPAKDETVQYKTDISFVGKLYQTEYLNYSAPLNQYQRGYLEGIISAQMKVYGGYFIPELVTKELLDDLNVNYRKSSSGTFEMGKKELEFMLACEATGRERYLALAVLSGHHQVDLYSTEKDTRLTKVTHKGYTDYYDQMPKIFHQSKINLNISLKTIRTGIPLRVLDSAGCGGFVISNFQEELAEHFVIGKECILYENLEDLCQKVTYYLAHDQQRMQIALAGRERVRRDFTFEDRMKQMLKI